MDVWGGVFVGDSTMSYGSSIRGPHFRDYEQFPYGTLEHSTSPPNTKDPYSKVQEKCKQMKLEKSQKSHCPFCKEHKKRPLVNYIRKRDSRRHHESICEDEEAAEEEDENEDQHEHEQDVKDIKQNSKLFV